MKVRLEPELQLIITPENYVEKIALDAWITQKASDAILVEAYIPQTLEGMKQSLRWARFSDSEIDKILESRINA